MQFFCQKMCTMKEILYSQFTGLLWLYGNDFHDSFDRYSCIKHISHTDIYWSKTLMPPKSIQEFVLFHYHNNKFGQYFCPLIFIYYHSFENFKQFIRNAICMRLRNPLYKQLYLWVICHHYFDHCSNQRLRTLIFAFDLPGFLCSISYRPLYLTRRVIKTI